MQAGVRLLIVCAMWLSMPVLAVNQDEAAVLAQDPRWQALLHINRGATLRHRGASYVRDPRFFLADNGADDALAELTASIRLLAPPAAPQRCLYPARYRFLATVLNWRESAPLAHCDDYQAWRAEVPDDRVVLVFPAAYLNSPSSMFGHTLLRFDRADQASDWHAWAVNFGAVVDSSDRSMLYIYRGIAGGYPGRFSTVPYVNKIQEYAHMENRDMWEYQLTLSKAEISWMLDHLWEIRDIDFAYYFLDENCSFRLLELIKVGRPQLALLEQYRFAEIPVNTVRTLEQQGLIAERVYRPSKAVELEQLAEQLSADEQELAARLMQNPAAAESDGYAALGADRQQLVARTAYLGLRYQQRSAERTPQVASTSMALLRLMNASGIRAGELNTGAEVRPPSAPEGGHPTKMVAVSGGALEDTGFAELQFRLSYHDWLDNPAGFMPGAWIEALNFRLRRSESDRVRLWTFDLINIRSMAPRSKFVKPLSWQVNAGIDRPVVAGRRGATRFIDGGAGLSWQWRGWQPYGYALARAENNDDQKVFINPGAGAELGLLRHFRYASLQLTARSLYFTDESYRHRYSARVQLPIGRRNGLRASVTHEDFQQGEETEWMVTWRHYFD